MVIQALKPEAVMDRYARNEGVITRSEQDLLAASRVFIAGLGGLGGYCLEMLARLGAGHITGADCGRFEPTNLNRQLLCTEDTAGLKKTEAAARRMASVNPSVEFAGIDQRITAANAAQLISGHDIVIDALDSARTRIILEKACAAENIPLIHGAVEGEHAQAAVILPGDKLLERLYAGSRRGKAPPAVPSFTPAAAAAMQVSLALKVLLNRPLPAPGTLFLLDLGTNESTQIKV